MSSSRGNYPSSSAAGAFAAGVSTKPKIPSSAATSKKVVGLNLSPLVGGGGSASLAGPSPGGKQGMKYVTTLLKAVCLLNKQIQVVKSISVSKFFHTWRLNSMTVPPQTRRLSLTAELEFGGYQDSIDMEISHSNSAALKALSPAPEEDSHSDILSSHSRTNSRTNSLLMSHKQNYLALFTENEKLREQYSDLRRSIQVKENNIRMLGGKSVLLVWCRAKYRAQTRTYFARWYTQTLTSKMKLDIEHRELQLDVGKQQVDSYLTYLRDTEGSNTVLKNNLLCTLYFMRWKTNAMFTTLNEERRVFTQQKRAFLNELTVVKQSLAASNRQEAAIVATALMRGTDMNNSLEHVRNMLNKAMKMHKSLNEHHKTKDSSLLTPNAPTLGGAVSGTIPVTSHAGGTQANPLAPVNSQGVGAGSSTPKPAAAKPGTSSVKLPLA
jgi:hypothetical protein